MWFFSLAAKPPYCLCFIGLVPDLWISAFISDLLIQISEVKWKASLIIKLTNCHFDYIWLRLFATHCSVFKTALVVSVSLCSTTCLSGGSPLTATSCPCTKRWSWTSCKGGSVKCRTLKGKTQQSSSSSSCWFVEWHCARKSSTAPQRYTLSY